MIYVQAVTEALFHYSVTLTVIGLSYAAASRWSGFLLRCSGGGRGGGFVGGSLMLSPMRFGGSFWCSMGSQCSPWIAACDDKVKRLIINQRLNVKCNGAVTLDFVYVNIFRTLLLMRAGSALPIFEISLLFS